MTPNFTEFEKMCKILGDRFKSENIEEQKKFIDEIYKQENDIIKINDIKTNEKYNKIFLNEINLCNEFKNNFILVKKGKCDIITDGIELYIVKNKGSLKRTGGIGDLLSGLNNCYCGMLNQRKKENPKYQQECIISHYELIKCCIFACYICREASRLAFEKMKYSLTAPDIITEIPRVVNKIYYL
jgi:NAD(P)H-hydrate repair Nnr-like enzyme with NAD(P)H-hydrate dehydratase domain